MGYLLIGGVAAIAIAVGSAGARAAAARRRQYQRATEAWREAGPADRVRALEPLLGTASGETWNPAAWFLLGCAHVKAGRLREAARAFGAAHHADWRLESAAMLTFACLKASVSEPPDLVAHIVATWEEMQHPGLFARRADQIMLECLQATSRDAPGLSPIGRLAWFVGSANEQAAIERGLCEPGQDDWTTLLALGAPPA